MLNTLSCTAASRWMARKPLGASRMSVPLSRRTTAGAKALQELLGGGKGLDLTDRALAHHHQRLAGQDGLDQLGDVGGLVLVVGIGVDDDIRTEMQRML